MPRSEETTVKGFVFIFYRPFPMRLHMYIDLHKKEKGFKKNTISITSAIYNVCCLLSSLNVLESFLCQQKHLWLLPLTAQPYHTIFRLCPCYDELSPTIHHRGSHLSCLLCTSGLVGTCQAAL